MAITAMEVLDERVFAAVPELRIISKYGVGLDTIDLAAMERYGVKLSWTAGTNKRSVAELVIAFAICLLHRVPQAAADIRDGKWRQLQGSLLTGRTVGIIGFGHIGKDVALLFKAFNCTVLAFDILDFPDFCAEHQIIPAKLEDLLRQADVITIHLPLDSTTANILNAERMSLIKSTAVLINTARGQLVDETIVKRKLISGELAGAAFDVFSTEPPEDIELLNLPNFFATPHIGGSTAEAILAMGRAAIAGLQNARAASVGLKDQR